MPLGLKEPVFWKSSALRSAVPPNAAPRRRRTAGAVCRRSGVTSAVYSGPSPPSGGVSRPPLAVIAPHWTQFEAVTSTLTTFPAGRGLAADLVHLGRAHVHPGLRDLAPNLAVDAEVARRVVARLVPREVDARELVEEERAVGRRVRALALAYEDRDARVCLELQVRRGGSLPSVFSARPARIAPRMKPYLKAGRMLRTRSRSFQT